MGNTITVYRCGSLATPLHNERMQASFKFFDDAAPKGRVLRGGAIFASPEREALTPWIAMKKRKRQRSATMQKANRELNPEFNQDVSVRHLDITLDDSLFVYNADLFGEIHVGACYTDFDIMQNDPAPYWESGIPLSEWRTSKFAGTKAAESWEVLVSREQIQNICIEQSELVMT